MRACAPNVFLACIALATVACHQHEPALTSPSVRLYSAGAIAASVRDATTGQPVEGAVVLAVWRKIETYVRRWDGVFLMKEAVTSADGSFTIPRWGPRPLGRDDYLDERGPEIWVIRRGYVATVFDQEGRKELSVIASRGANPFVILPPNVTPGNRTFERALTAHSSWNGRTLLLRTARDAGEEQTALAIANPLDPYQHFRNDCPLYWAEWEASRDALPQPFRSGVPDRPRHGIDYVVLPRR